MRDPLTIAVAQPVSVKDDVAANAVAHASAIRKASARVVVFPELSLTGYYLDAPVIALADDRMAPVIEACAATGSIALAGAPIEGDYIAMLAIDGTGVTVAYRKMWPGDEEAKRFIPGTKPSVLEVDGWRLGLAICRDTGIAQHADDTAALGIDAYVAGTVKLPSESAMQDERAQRVAVKHGVWVAIASGARPAGGGFTSTAGRSGIWRPGGALVTQAGAEPGEVVVSELS
jgi:predicted amidohydrolase